MSMLIKEEDDNYYYIGLSEANMEKQVYEIPNNKDLNFKATELRLGLPGSESPEREVAVHGGNIKILVAGAKRGFSDAIKGGSWKWVLAGDGGLDVDLVKHGGNKNHGSVQENNTHDKSNGQTSSSSSDPKEQVVGWPPIRSFRKNTMAVSHTKTERDGDPKVGPGCLYVKVSMDGAPYLRKVDLETYSCYLDLSSALEKMFSCFTIVEYGSHGVRTREGLSESRLKDLLHASEYVLTYEDKDGDWMLVGDVPWDMFIASCTRMRIMKSSDAIGLAPRAMEKCRNRTERDNK